MGLLVNVSTVATSEKFDVFKSVLFSLYSVRHCFFRIGTDNAIILNS